MGDQHVVKHIILKGGNKAQDENETEGGGEEKGV